MNAGNMNGIIGYGKGKAIDMEQAMVKANNNLKRIGDGRLVRVVSKWQR